MSIKDKNTVASIITSIQQTSPNWEELLANVISCFDCSTGTIHFLDEKTTLLNLETQVGIPEFLIPKLSAIPVGKGMAGIAAERREPVEMCNLQTDDSGVARPSAKETKVEGSIVVPMMLNDKLYGTLGIAKPVPYDFTEQEKLDLMNIGKTIAKVKSLQN